MTADKTAVPEWIDVAFADSFGWSTYAAHEGDKTRFIRSDLCASGQVRALTRAAGDESKAGWIVSFDDLQAIRAAAGDWGYGIDLEAVEAIALDVERRILAALTPAPQHEGLDNPSGMACTGCRSVGAWHCSDPENCGGMKPMRSACTCNEPWCKACAPAPATPTAQEAAPTEDELDEAWKSGFNAGFGEAKLTTNPPQPSVSVAEEALCSEILAELTRARTKFPGKNVTFAALVEEVGELATATFEESADRVRKEAVQVAVMAMRMILDGDNCYEPWRAEKGLDPLDPALRALKGGDANG